MEDISLHMKLGDILWEGDGDDDFEDSLQGSVCVRPLGLKLQMVSYVA